MEELHKQQQAFLNNLEDQGKSFNTIKNYRTDLKCFRDFLANKNASQDLNEFSDEQVREYSRYIEQKYESSNSRRRRIQALRLFFDYMIQQGQYSENPIKKIMSAPKVVDIPNPLSYKNVAALYRYLHQKYQDAQGIERLLCLRNKVLIHLIYGAGLKVSDIQLIHKQHISQGKDKLYRVLIAHPKRDPYTIILERDFGKVYETYTLLLEEQKNKDQIEFDQLLFNANPFKILNGGLSARGCEILFEEFSKGIGEKVTPRSLRQSCIFKWLTNGRQESTIKEWMGVRPVYSLAPFKMLIEEAPDKFIFRELQEQVSEE